MSWKADLQLTDQMEGLYQQAFAQGYLRPSLLEDNEVHLLYDHHYDLHFTYQISYARAGYQSSPSALPAGAQCAICREQAGSPGKEQLQLLDLTLEDGSEHFLQLTPFPLYPRHYVLISREHRRMQVDRTMVAQGLQFLDRAPEYTVCSNSDLPWAGASILSHSHFQVFCKLNLPVMNCRRLFTLYEDAQISITTRHYRMPVISLIGNDRTKVASEAARIIRSWKARYPQRATVNMVMSKSSGTYTLLLILRHADHRNPEHLMRFKSEGIGVIEAAGSWVFPPASRELLQKLHANSRSIIKELTAAISPFDPAVREHFDVLHHY